MSEIEAFPHAVLRHHYGDTPLHGDFTTIQAGQYEPIDVLVGGTPCQSFSVAGLRGGMDDARGNLALEYLLLADRLRPRWLVWENVPGVLSSNGGRDFGSILGGLVQLGYGFAYRVLDAQFFGLAQRRKRVFVVGYLGDWRRAAAVLFEPASLRWHPAPSRAAGQRIAPTVARGSPAGGRTYGLDADTCDSLVAQTLTNHHQRLDGESDAFVVAPPLTHNPYGDHESREGLLVAHSLRVGGFDASEDGTGRGTPLVPVYAIQERAVSVNVDAGPGGKGWSDEGSAFTLEARNKVQAVAFQSKASSNQSMNPGVVSPGLDVGKSGGIAAFVGSAVRRLTPLECEKLQGFPLGYTAIHYRGKPAADGPRYKALGNSMAVPCMAWIGRRIAIQDSSKPKGK